MVLTILGMPVAFNKLIELRSRVHREKTASGFCNSVYSVWPLFPICLLKVKIFDLNDAFILKAQKYSVVNILKNSKQLLRPKIELFMELRFFMKGTLQPEEPQRGGLFLKT